MRGRIRVIAAIRIWQSFGGKLWAISASPSPGESKANVLIYARHCLGLITNRHPDMREASHLFADGEAYERLMGRWSRVVGEIFLDWLDIPVNRQWLDVGCGNGAF